MNDRLKEIARRLGELFPQSFIKVSANYLGFPGAMHIEYYAMAMRQGENTYYFRSETVRDIEAIEEALDKVEQDTPTIRLQNALDAIKNATAG